MVHTQDPQIWNHSLYSDFLAPLATFINYIIFKPHLVEGLRAWCRSHAKTAFLAHRSLCSFPCPSLLWMGTALSPSQIHTRWYWALAFGFSVLWKTSWKEVPILLMDPKLRAFEDVWIELNGNVSWHICPWMHPESSLWVMELVTIVMGGVLAMMPRQGCLVSKLKNI